MKRSVRFMLVGVLTGAVCLPLQTAWAADQTVRLRVERMTCFTCPFTVRTALRRVAGVKRVKVSLFRRRAVVVFDDTRTDVAALTTATAHAGYPSRLMK